MVAFASKMEPGALELGALSSSIEGFFFELESPTR